MRDLPPFRLAVAEDALAAVAARVAAFPWHESPQGDPFAHGIPIAVMREIADHWTAAYDFRAAEARLNRFPQILVPVTVGEETIALHAILEPGSGPSPRPLLLLHGWPGSHFEFLDLVEPLAHPERFGGRVEDAFSVVVPSLPGFGFSGKPRAPIGPRRMARFIDGLMTAHLGFASYVAQGGDWGSIIASWLAFEGHARAIHVNMFGWRMAGFDPQTEEERAWAAARAASFEREGAYAQIQGTKPQTLSYAMMDSPLGLAAWIIEKFHAWSAVGEEGLFAHFSKETLITNAMIYILTRSFNTAAWVYAGRAAEARDLRLAPGTRIERPVAAALFPGDRVFPFPPRSLAERAMDIVRWTPMPRGGHFAALEAGDLLVEDLRAFARQTS